MAHHWKNAGDIHKAISYYEKAGEQAYQLFSEEGVRIYTELVNCLISPDYRDEDPIDRSLRTARACIRLVESSFQTEGFPYRYHFIIVGLDACHSHIPIHFRNVDRFSYNESLFQRIYSANLLTKIWFKGCFPMLFNRFEKNTKEAEIQESISKLYLLMAYTCAINSADVSYISLKAVESILSVDGDKGKKALILENSGSFLMASGWKMGGKFLLKWSKSLSKLDNNAQISKEMFFAKSMALVRSGQWNELKEMMKDYSIHCKEIGDRFGLSLCLFNMAFYSLIHEADFTSVSRLTREAIDGKAKSLPSIGRICLWLFSETKKVQVDENLERVVQLLENRCRTDITVESLFERATLSKYYLCRGNHQRCLYHLQKIHQNTRGITPNFISYSINFFFSIFLDTTFELAEDLIMKKSHKKETQSAFEEKVGNIKYEDLLRSTLR